MSGELGSAGARDGTGRRCRSVGANRDGPQRYFWRVGRTFLRCPNQLSRASRTGV